MHIMCVCEERDRFASGEAELGDTILAEVVMLVTCQIGCAPLGDEPQWRKQLGHLDSIQL